MKHFHCFAYATGRIGFGDETPDDALLSIPIEL